MVTSKNHAAAVRSYLASIGQAISHVQALEVIARGAGLRSRHVKGSATVAGAKGSSGCARCDARAQLLKCACSKCGTRLEGDYCPDEMCIYRDWPQSVIAYDIYELSTPAIEQKYGTKKRVFSESYAQSEVEALSASIKEDYLDSGCQRSDLEQAIQRLRQECDELFEDEEAAMSFLMDLLAQPESAKPVAPPVKKLAKTIKKEYLASRCAADDVDHAVNRLMKECSFAFDDARYFINNKDHKKTGEVTFVIHVQSDLFGNNIFSNFTEIFSYSTKEKRRAGLVRFMAKAVELNDGISRDYFFSDIDSDLEKNSPEYAAALEERELEGQLDADTVVHYQGQRIGTIANITENGLTLYSWIDDNP